MTILSGTKAPRLPVQAKAKHGYDVTSHHWQRDYDYCTFPIQNSLKTFRNAYFCGSIIPVRMLGKSPIYRLPATQGNIRYEWFFVWAMLYFLSPTYDTQESKVESFASKDSDDLTAIKHHYI